MSIHVHILLLADSLCALLFSLWPGIMKANEAMPTVQVGVSITVTTSEDELNSDGDCSLREAIASANIDAGFDACVAGFGEDTITLPAGVYTLNLPGSGENNNQSGDLDILDNIIIGGPTDADGAPLATISASGIDRVFHIPGDVSATLYNLIIQDGHAPDGTEADCGIDGGSPCNGESGGGLFNAGTLTLINCRIRNNVSGSGANNTNFELQKVSGAGGDGGGIYNEGTVSARNAMFENNRTGYGAHFTGCARDRHSSYGGAIYNAGTFTLHKSLVFQNSVANVGALACPPAIIGGRGADGGGIYNDSVMTISNSAIWANGTGRGQPGRGTHGQAGDDGKGGGIYNRGALVVLNSTISVNSTGLYGGDPVGYGSNEGGDGAGIMNLGNLSISHVTIAGNFTQSGSGGGIYNVGQVNAKNVLVADNSASVEGPDCWGEVKSYGYGLIQNSTFCTVTGLVNTVMLDVQALLSPPGYYGSNTITHALTIGSPAVDSGNCYDILGRVVATDQRGEPRPQNITCDLGAYEASTFANTLLPIIYTSTTLE